MKNPLKMTLATLLAATAWALLTPAHAADPVKSMRGADVSAVDAAADSKSYVGKRPGTQPLVARTFSTQPPVIPHAVENFDEITLEENQCLSCHGPDVYKKKNSPMIGESHLIDRDGKKLKTASAARYDCLQCHVVQVAAPLLVENAFKGDIVLPTEKTKK